MGRHGSPAPVSSLFFRLSFLIGWLAPHHSVVCCYVLLRRAAEGGLGPKPSGLHAGVSTALFRAIASFLSWAVLPPPPYR